MAISHKNIPESERHNPKGFETAGNNSVAKKNGSGNLEWNTVDNDELTGNIGAEKFQTGVTESQWIASTAQIARTLTSSSSNVLARDDDERDNTLGLSWETASSINFGQSGNVRVYCQALDGTSGSGETEVRFMKNGSQFGPLYTALYSDGWTTFQDTVSVAVGDNVQIQFRFNLDSNWASIRNCRILANNYDPLPWFFATNIQQPERSW